jgi:CheY-like chemotaxis protein
MARILIVDDSSFARFKLRKTLTAMGHEVIEAENGRQALDLLEGSSFSCIFIDILMPEMDGIQTIDEIRKKAIDVPIAVVSADVQNSTREMCFERGVKAFLNKPMKEEDLKKVLEGIV